MKLTYRVGRTVAETVAEEVVVVAVVVVVVEEEEEVVVAVEVEKIVGLRMVVELTEGVAGIQTTKFIEWMLDVIYKLLVDIIFTRFEKAHLMLKLRNCVMLNYSLLVVLPFFHCFNLSLYICKNTMAACLHDHLVFVHHYKVSSTSIIRT